MVQTVISDTAPNRSEELEDRRHRFTVDEYARADIERRTELIDGEVYDLSPQYEPHARIVRAVFKALDSAVGGERAFPTGSVGIDLHSMPEPDVFVLRPDYKRGSGPFRAADVETVVEISATTSARDERKADLYAAAGIDVYWRYDLPTETLHRLSAPTDDGYGERHTTQCAPDDVAAAIAGE